MTPKKSTIYLLAPIALGGGSTATGHVREEGSAGTRIFDRADFKGKSQFFPGHLVERVEIEKENGND